MRLAGIVETQFKWKKLDINYKSHVKIVAGWLDAASMFGRTFLGMKGCQRSVSSWMTPENNLPIATQKIPWGHSNIRTGIKLIFWSASTASSVAFLFGGHIYCFQFLSPLGPKYTHAVLSWSISKSLLQTRIVAYLGFWTNLLSVN